MIPLLLLTLLSIAIQSQTIEECPRALFAHDDVALTYTTTEDSSAYGKYSGVFAVFLT